MLFHKLGVQFSTIWQISIILFYFLFKLDPFANLFYFIPKMSYRHGNWPLLPHPSPDSILAYNNTKKKLALGNGDKCDKCGIWYWSHSHRLLTGLTWCTLVLLSLLSHWKLAFGDINLFNQATCHVC